jgi:hypothetical protein
MQYKNATQKVLFDNVLMSERKYDVKQSPLSKLDVVTEINTEKIKLSDVG